MALRIAHLLVTPPSSNNATPTPSRPSSPQSGAQPHWEITPSPDTPRAANDGAASLIASDRPKDSPTPSPPPIDEVKATSTKRGIGEMTSQILWNETDVANAFKVTKVSNNGWRNCCLALSYNQSRNARRLEESRAVESTEDIYDAALQLRQELTKELLHQLPPMPQATGWSANMSRERVRSTHSQHPTLCVPLFWPCALDVPCVLAPSAQATHICEHDLMMTEAHVHALVNLKKESVVVISDKHVNKKVKRLACFLYAPGWAEQREVCKRELKDLLADPKSAPHLIYHGGFHYAAYLPSARVANDTSNAVTVSSPSPENSGRQTRRDGRSLGNAMPLE